LVVDVLETSVNEDDLVIPAEFDLKHNFPNPFNPTTIIRFDLPKPCFVSLKIYDSIGRTLEILTNENRAAGRYSIEWKPENQPSGIYLCRLQAGDFVQTRKLIYQR
jgi:hypothetical protein